MRKILKIRNVSDYSRWLGHIDTHPLVSVIDYTAVSPVRHSLNHYSIYGIFFTKKPKSIWHTVAVNTTIEKELSFVWHQDKSEERKIMEKRCH